MKIRRGLAESEYFERCLKELTTGGLELFAVHELSTDELPYYERLFAFAKVVTFFFKVPEKGTLIQARLTEEVTPGGRYTNFWTLYLHAELARKEALEAAMEGVRIPRLRIFGEAPSPFRYGGGAIWTERHQFVSRFDGESSSARLAPEELAQAALRLVAEVTPFAERCFSGLQLTDFPPRHEFPGSERSFWKKFPIGKLRQIAPGAKIWKNWASSAGGNVMPP